MAKSKAVPVSDKPARKGRGQHTAKPAKGTPQQSKTRKPARKSDTAREDANLQATVHRNPLRALYFVAREYRARVGTELDGSRLATGSELDGLTLGAAPARILLALAQALGAYGEQDIGALDRDENPHLWARNYLKNTPTGVQAAILRNGRSIPIRVPQIGPLPTRIDALRELVAEVHEKRDASAESLADYGLTWLLFSHPRAIGLGRPVAADPDDTERRILTEIKKVKKRASFTDEHLVIAILVGWGMKRDTARSALKKA